MPEGYYSTICDASELMQDDFFKLGGELYRIAEIEENSYDELVITFYPVVKDNSRVLSTLITPKNTTFKRYNQGTSPGAPTRHPYGVLNRPWQRSKTSDRSDGVTRGSSIGSGRQI